MTTPAQELWLDEKARSVGHPGRAAFADAYALRPYRLTQLYHAATCELAADLEAVSVLPRDLRTTLVRDGLQLETVAPLTVQRSNDGQTSKGLFRLHDGNEVEAVLMEHWNERTPARSVRRVKPATRATLRPSKSSTKRVSSRAS